MTIGGLEQQVAVFIEASHLTRQIACAIAHGDRLAVIRQPAGPVVVHRAEAFMLPGIDPGQEMARDRLEKLRAIHLTCAFFVQGG